MYLLKTIMDDEKGTFTEEMFLSCHDMMDRTVVCLTYSGGLEWYSHLFFLFSISDANVILTSFLVRHMTFDMSSHPRPYSN